MTTDDQIARAEREGPRRGKVGVVFFASLAVALAFIGWGVFFTDSMQRFNAAALETIIRSFGWVYLIATTFFIFFLLFLAMSRFGRIRLGRDEDRPEFSTLSWWAMLFSAGMGIGRCSSGSGSRYRT